MPRSSSVTTLAIVLLAEDFGMSVINATSLDKKKPIIYVSFHDPPLIQFFSLHFGMQTNSCMECHGTNPFFNLLKNLEVKWCDEVRPNSFPREFQIYSNFKMRIPLWCAVPNTWYLYIEYKKINLLSPIQAVFSPFFSPPIIPLVIGRANT